MESEWELVGRRVRQARLIRQLDQAQLATAIDVERSALSKIESGTRRVSALELVALGGALFLPLRYFVTEPPRAIVSRRKALQDSATDAEQTRFELDLVLEQHLADVEQIRDMGYLPRGIVPEFTGMATTEDASSLAAQTRGLLGMATEPLGPLADVAAQLGLWLLVVQHGLEGASLSPEPGFGVGILGADKKAGRRRFTAAHEIGHHIIGDEYSSDIGVAASRNERESLIDRFAQSLLLPIEVCEQSLIGVADEEVRDILISLSARYRLSWSVTCRAAIEAVPGKASAVRRAGGDTPLKADFIRVTGALVQEDLTEGHTASFWRQAVLRSYGTSKISANRAIELLHGALSMEDLPDVSAPVLP